MNLLEEIPTKKRRIERTLPEHTPIPLPELLQSLPCQLVVSLLCRYFDFAAETGRVDFDPDRGERCFVVQYAKPRARYKEFYLQPSVPCRQFIRYLFGYFRSDPCRQTYLLIRRFFVSRNHLSFKRVIGGIDLDLVSWLPKIATLELLSVNLDDMFVRSFFSVPKTPELSDIRLRRLVYRGAKRMCPGFICQDEKSVWLGFPFVGVQSMQLYSFFDAEKTSPTVFGIPSSLNDFGTLQKRFTAPGKQKWPFVMLGRSETNYADFAGIESLRVSHRKLDAKEFGLLLNSSSLKCLTTAIFPISWTTQSRSELFRAISTTTRPNISKLAFPYLDCTVEETMLILVQHPRLRNLEISFLRELESEVEYPAERSRVPLFSLTLCGIFCSNAHSQILFDYARPEVLRRHSSDRTVFPLKFDHLCVLPMVMTFHLTAPCPDRNPRRLPQGWGTNLAGKFPNLQHLTVEDLVFQGGPWIPRLETWTQLVTEELSVLSLRYLTIPVELRTELRNDCARSSEMIAGMLEVVRVKLCLTCYYGREDDWPPEAVDEPLAQLAGSVRGRMRADVIFSLDWRDPETREIVVF